MLGVEEIISTKQRKNEGKESNPKEGGTPWGSRQRPPASRCGKDGLKKMIGRGNGERASFLFVKLVGKGSIETEGLKKRCMEPINISYSKDRRRERQKRRERVIL